MEEKRNNGWRERGKERERRKIDSSMMQYIFAKAFHKIF
jgi:hypothetical protein